MHAEAFKDISHQLCSSRCAAPIVELEVEAPDGRLPLYYAALAAKESAKMPTVGSSIDRRCIDNFLQRHKSENLSALPSDPVDSELPWCDLAATQRAVGAGN